jgi:hypothetical protein
VAELGEWDVGDGLLVLALGGLVLAKFNVGPYVEHLRCNFFILALL